MAEINWKNKCWVTTIYLVRQDGSVLLTWNKNLQTWIPVGGHIEPGETPEEATTREVAEETGFEFEFLNAPLLPLFSMAITSRPIWACFFLLTKKGMSIFRTSKTLFRSKIDNSDILLDG